MVVAVDGSHTYTQDNTCDDVSFMPARLPYSGDAKEGNPHIIKRPWALEPWAYKPMSLGLGLSLVQHLRVIGGCHIETKNRDVVTFWFQVELLGFLGGLFILNWEPGAAFEIHLGCHLDATLRNVVKFRF